MIASGTGESGVQGRVFGPRGVAIGVERMRVRRPWGARIGAIVGPRWECGAGAGDAEVDWGRERTGAADPGPGKAHWDRTGPKGAGECDVSVLLEPPQDDACAGCMTCGNKKVRLCHA